MYEGEVTEISPEYTEAPSGTGYGKAVSADGQQGHVGELDTAQLCPAASALGTCGSACLHRAALQACHAFLSAVWCGRSLRMRACGHAGRSVGRSVWVLTMRAHHHACMHANGSRACRAGTQQRC